MFSREEKLWGKRIGTMKSSFEIFVGSSNEIRQKDDKAIGIFEKQGEQIQNFQR